MARIHLGAGGTDEVLHGRDWYAQFSTLGLSNEKSSEAIYKDASGNTIAIEGRGLDSANSSNVTGTISDVTIEDSSGRMIFDISDLSATYSEIRAVLIQPGKYSMLEVLTRLIDGNDMITGTDGSEILMTTVDAGNDTIRGLGGNDFFRAGPGDNILKGGTGVDQLVYDTDWWTSAPQTGGVVLDAGHGTARNPWGGHDRISGFEEFTGSNQSDRMVGSWRADKFASLAGSDVLNGRGGVDTIDYSHDDHYGGHAGIIANLTTHSVIDGFGMADTVRNFESVLGTKYADSIIGSAKAEVFRGLAGNDEFDGRGGADRFLFVGGFDSDRIAGFEASGSRHDVIQFNDFSGVDSFSDLQNGHMQQAGNNTVIDMGGGDVLTLENVMVGDLNARDFYFG